MTEVRTDILHAALGACWLVEQARLGAYAMWEASEHAARTADRLGILERTLEQRGVRLPRECLDGHAAWMVSMVGEQPHSLGPAMLRRYGQWVDAYSASVLEDPDAFAGLGRIATRIAAADPVAGEWDPFLPGREPGPGRRVVVLNDIHIGERGADTIARKAVEEINTLDADVVLVAGDITDDGEPEQFEVAKAILDGLSSPWHPVLGNHDAVRRSTRTGDGPALFEAAFGTPAHDVVLDVDGVQIALLDSSDPTAWPLPDFDLASGTFRSHAGGTASGAYRPGQAEAIAQRLDPRRPALVVQHHEMQPFCAFPPYQFAVREQDSSTLLGALASHRILGFVAGHTHRSALAAAGTHLPLLEVPALKEWPLCYTVLAVQPDRVHATVHQLRDADLVTRAARRVTPTLRNYFLGPLTALEHTFS